MNDNATSLPPARILLVGLRVAEREQFTHWAERNDVEVWFAGSTLEALRVFDEVRPTHLIVDTLVSGSGEQLARVVTAATRGVKVVFISNHNVEAAYYSRPDGLPNASHAFRPIDPEEIAGRVGIIPDTVGGIATRGDVSFEGLSDLFLAVFKQRGRGLLYLGTGAFRKVVYFHDGRPSYATSMALDENFGRYLLRRGVINRVEFEWARKLQMREGIRQGDALVKIGVLTTTTLDEYLRDQVRMKLLNAFKLEHIAYRYEPCLSLPGQLRYDFNVASLLMDAATHCGVVQATEPDRTGEELWDALADCLGNEISELRSPKGSIKQPERPSTEGLRWLLDRAKPNDQDPVLVHSSSQTAPLATH
ncbi:MAG: hypothetical protein ACJAYU_004652 [Bradymonadia bacterium]|jgi:hypothetical protein